MNIFELMYPQYKITKPIRLIEMFGGYGSQHFALKYLGANVEHWKLVEWAVKSIQAYKDAHYTNIKYDCDNTITKEVLVDYLFKVGISFDYNKPATLQEIQRKKFEELKQISLNIKITKNLVNICNVKGEDLEIVDQDKYDYIITLSFPCQDLSLAGLRKGMNDTSTRSGMLWEVERILKELNELKTLPQILLMENVPQVIGTENVNDFNKWQTTLESLGYKNYHQNLIATDYGIPQTRNRTFMISILGDYSYTFPQPTPLKLKLKDMLENNVNEKYYLSDKQIKDVSNWNAYQKPLDNMEQIDNSNISPTLTTRSGAYAAGMVLVKEATKKGYAEASPYDGIYIQNIKGKRGMVQKGKMQTLKTSPDTGVLMPDLRIRKLTPKECFRLMGVKDEDYENIAKNQSDASLYHLAGDSIVVNVLMAIFKELL